MSGKLKVIFVVIFILSLLAAGCGETTTPEKVEPGNKSESSEAGPPETFAVGEAVKMGDLEFIVNSVHTSEGSQFLKPDEGNVFFLADCTITNHAGEPVNISSLMMFKLVDGEGYSYSVTVGPETRGSLDGELAPGRKMRGELAFEVPAQAESLELIFEPNLFGFGQAIYEVK